MSFVYVDMEEEAYGLMHVILHNTGIMAADIESTGLDCFSDEILLFQLNIADKIYVIDVRAIGYEMLTRLVSCINSNGRTVILHNAKFDMKFLYNKTGIMLENVYDTMICESVLNAGIGKVLYSLSELAEKYTDTFMEKDSRKDFIDFPRDKSFTESMLIYAALDVKVLPEIYEKQMDLVLKAYEVDVINLEMKLIPVVAEMEYVGIRLDKDRWLEIEKQAKEKLESLTVELRDMILRKILGKVFKNGLELAKACAIPVKTKKLIKLLEELTDIGAMSSWLKEHMNIGSPLQMKTILHLLGVNVKDTNEKTLEDYKGNEIIDKLLEIREVSKQVSTYGVKFLEVINPVTGKVHTDYFQTGAATGRFSSSRPNMQNIPRDGGYRECFVPEQDHLFISIDYSQQEYRLAGAISKDPVIIQAYKDGSDMHTSTAKIVEGKDVVTKEERLRGKTVNFAILYGSTEYGLKRNLRISIEQSEQIINAFWKGYRSLSLFMELAGKKIMELGFSSTPLGRRRYNLPKPLYLDSRGFVKWMERVLREGRNHIIQGGGADILKLAMVRIRRENPYGNGLRILLQVHDELLVEVKKDIANDAMYFVKRVMEEEEQAFLGEIPAKTEELIKERWSK
jgi:DNA polymerase-1